MGLNQNTRFLYHKAYKKSSGFLKEILPFFCLSWYTISATQSNSRDTPCLNCGKTLVKGVFSLYSYRNWDEIVWQQ
nr:MAG TPA: DNA-directed RNA polymerase [Caudoviricetes sp.]